MSIDFCCDDPSSATVWRKGADDNALDATGVPDDMKEAP